MELVVAKILCLFGVFVSMLFSSFLPLKIVSSTGENRDKRGYRFLSYSNCVAGGVFLGTCFISLFPTVKSKFKAVLSMNEETFPIAELTIMMGYFLMLFMEQLAAACSDHGKKQEEPMEMTSAVKKANGSSLDDVEEEDKVDMHSSDEEEQIFSREIHPLSDDFTSHSQGHGHGHGHGHSHSHLMSPGGSALRRYMLLLALSIHSVFEGTALGLQEDMSKMIHLFVAIVLHEILVAFAFGANLAKMALRRSVFVQMVVFFCIMIPLGVAIGIAVGHVHGFVGGLTSAILQGLAAGTFIYVVFVEILPSELVGGENNIWKIFCVFIGFILFTSLQFIDLIH